MISRSIDEFIVFYEVTIVHLLLFCIINLTYFYRRFSC